MVPSITKAGLQQDPYRLPLEALLMTVGLFPELVQHLEATRQPVHSEELRQAVVRGIANHAQEAVQAVNVRNTLIGVGLLAAILLVGAVSGPKGR